jgi:hypothetical protein
MSIKYMKSNRSPLKAVKIEKYDIVTSFFFADTATAVSIYSSATDASAEDAQKALGPRTYETPVSDNPYEVNNHSLFLSAQEKESKVIKKKGCVYRSALLFIH